MQTERLSSLFGKMVIDGASHSEETELKTLYKKLINNDDRNAVQKPNGQVVRNYL